MQIYLNRVLTGDSGYNWFGHTIKLVPDSDLLAVGSPIWNRDTNSAGKVSLVDLGRMSVVDEINGGEEFSQLGYSVAVGKVKIGGEDVDVMAVGAPTSGSDFQVAILWINAKRYLYALMLN